MRRQWIVGLITAAFVFAATAAYATLPARLNGTTLIWCGAQFDAEFSGATQDSEVTFGSPLSSQTGTTNGLNGTITRFNTAGSAGTATPTFAENEWVAGQTFQGVSSLLALTDTDGNAAEDFYFINNQATTLFAGLSAANLDGSGTAGPSLAILTQNLTTPLNNTTLTDGTWYYYSVGTLADDADDRFAFAGTLTFAADGTGTANIGLLSTNGSNATALNDAAFAWSISDDGVLGAATTGDLVVDLFTNATQVDDSADLLVGFGARTAATIHVNKAIAIKTTDTALDFVSEGFRFVTIGGYQNASAAPIGRLGDVITDADGAVTSGTQAVVMVNGTSSETLSGTYAVSTAALASVTHGTAALGNSTFVGVENARGVKVGFFNGTSAAGATDALELALILPTSTTLTVGGPSGADITSLTDAFGNSTAVVTASAGTFNAVAASQAAVQSASIGALATQFGINSAAEQFGDIVAFNLDGLGTGTGDVVLLEIAIDNTAALAGETPAGLGDLVKLYDNGSATGIAANSTATFTYRETGAIADGQWWIANATNATDTQLLSEEFNPASTDGYVIYVAIADNGPFDTSGANGTVTDPFGIFSGSGTDSTDDDDDDDGCVFNPAAGFSLEMLLALLAPVAILVRRRK